MNIESLAVKARSASITLASLSSEIKNRALSEIADALDKNREAIINANNIDLENASQLSAPVRKRLLFDSKKIDGVIEGINSLIALDDPVGKTLMSRELDAGLELYRVSCPIGVIGVIFESRPDALVQISTLCLKSGNAVLLKGGSEAANTNRILADIITAATSELPQGWLSLLETREDVKAMLALHGVIDLIIPRGSNEFVRYILENSAIPVLGHADGICHCYIDKSADLDMAVSIAVDSKTQYVSVCNALETLLVSADIAPVVLPMLKTAFDDKGVELFGCERVCRIINVSPAAEDDWRTEYLDYKLSVKIVDSVEEAVKHINTYGSGHTDCIVTDNAEAAGYFMDMVDSGNVFWNCSTRFSDGFRYGFGAEVGISTNKIHARGPVGLDGLLIYKYKLIGSGQTVDCYASGQKKFTHAALDKDCPL